MNAVERMVEYTSQPTEGSAQALTQDPPRGWPHAGAITIDNLQVSCLIRLSMMASATLDLGICRSTLICYRLPLERCPCSRWKHAVTSLDTIQQCINAG